MAEEISEPASEIIEDSDTLMRWVHKWNADRRADGSIKKLKPGAFPIGSSDEQGISVFLQKILTFDQCKKKATEADPLHVAIVMLTAADFRQHGLNVTHKPEDGEYSHCEITGYQSKTDDELTDIKRQLILQTKERIVAF